MSSSIDFSSEASKEVLAKHQQKEEQKHQQKEEPTIRHQPQQHKLMLNAKGQLVAVPIPPQLASST